MDLLGRSFLIQFETKEGSKSNVTVLAHEQKCRCQVTAGTGQAEAGGR